MESVIVKAVDQLMSMSPEALDDKDGLISSCLVKGVAAFSNINKIALASRAKNLTDAKCETIATELSRVLFYAATLTHLLEFDPDEFDVDEMSADSEDMPDEFQNDTILCSMHGIQQFLFLVESEFGPNYEDAPSFGDGSPTSVSVAEGIEDIEMDIDALRSIFMCVIVLCERLELDFEVVMANAGINQKI
jgi:hypothetical protein